MFSFLFCHHSYELKWLPGTHKGSRPAAAAKEEPQKKELHIEVPKLSLEELKEKTDNFGSKSLVGEGSYGRVYYAVLNNGQQVAIKKLDVSSEADSSQEEFLHQVCLMLSSQLLFLCSIYVFLEMLLLFHLWELTMLFFWQSGWDSIKIEAR